MTESSGQSFDQPLDYDSLKVWELQRVLEDSLTPGEVGKIVSALSKHSAKAPYAQEILTLLDLARQKILFHNNLASDIEHRGMSEGNPASTLNIRNAFRGIIDVAFAEINPDTEAALIVEEEERIARFKNSG